MITFGRTDSHIINQMIAINHKINSLYLSKWKFEFWSHLEADNIN